MTLRLWRRGLVGEPRRETGDPLQQAAHDCALEPARRETCLATLSERESSGEGLWGGLLIILNDEERAVSAASRLLQLLSPVDEGEGAELLRRTVHRRFRATR